MQDNIYIWPAVTRSKYGLFSAHGGAHLRGEEVPPGGGAGRCRQRPQVGRLTYCTLYIFIILHTKYYIHIAYIMYKYYVQSLIRYAYMERDDVASVSR